MILYILNFISIPIYNLILKKKKNVVRIVSFQMFLILALRAETVGADLILYEKYFRVWNDLSLSEILKGFRLLGGANVPYGHESGYVFLNWIVGNLGFSFHGFLVICAAICMYSMGKFIYKYSENPEMSFLFFLALGGYEYFFGILRQSLGLAVFLFSIPSLKKRKFWKYMLYVAGSALFHSAFLFAIPLYFLCSIRVKRRHYGLMIGLSLGVVAISPLALQYIVKPIFDFFGKAYYFEGFRWNNMYLLMVVLSVLIMLFYKENLNKENYIISWGFLYALSIQAIAFYISIFSRAAIGIFLPFLYVAFANMLQEMKDKYLACAMRFTLYIGLFLFYVYTLPNAYNVPYISIFYNAN